MDTTTSTVAAVLITAVGQWARGKGISIKLVVGMMVLAVFLTALSSANEDLGKKFSVLILVGAIFANAIPITKKLGFSK